MVNQLQSIEAEGMPYLRDVFTQFLDQVGIAIDAHKILRESFDLFFEKAEGRLEDAAGGMPASVDSFRKIFSYPSGVVVNTCHGVKGEEFDTVIAFGLLRGFVPHWEAIIHDTDAVANQRESKLLYVVASRAKRQLYFISENGRRTRPGRPYQTSHLLESVVFDYDTPLSIQGIDSNLE